LLLLLLLLLRELPLVCLILLLHLLSELLKKGDLLLHFLQLLLHVSP
jgi:hypothetical protein